MTIYNQIYKSMLKLITSGSWKIGKQLPSENFLKQHYKVNRLTIRKALEILANENLIIKKKGSRAKVISRRPVPKVYFSTSLDDPVLKKKRWSTIVEFTKKRSTSSKRFHNENIFQIRRYFYDNETPSYIATGQVLIKSVPDLNEKVFNLQKFNNASLSFISLGRRAAITIAVVRLSNTAEKKKVITLKIQIRYTFLFVVILSVIIEKP